MDQHYAQCKIVKAHAAHMKGPWEVFVMDSHDLFFEHKLSIFYRVPNFYHHFSCNELYFLKKMYFFNII